MLPLVSSTMPEADRHALVAEVRDLLQLVLFVDDEVLLPQARNEAPVPVDDGRRHVDEIDAAAEAELFLLLSRDARAAGDDDDGKRCRETDRRPQHVFHINNLIQYALIAAHLPVSYRLRRST